MFLLVGRGQPMMPLILADAVERDDGLSLPPGNN